MCDTWKERERDILLYSRYISRREWSGLYIQEPSLSRLVIAPFRHSFPSSYSVIFFPPFGRDKTPLSFQFFFFFFFFSARFLPSSTYFPTTSSPFYTHTQTSTSDVKSFRSLSCCSCCLVPRSTPFHHSIYFFGPSYTVLYSSPFYWWLFGSCLLLFVYWLCYTGPSISFCLIYSYL